MPSYLGQRPVLTTRICASFSFFLLSVSLCASFLSSKCLSLAPHLSLLLSQPDSALSSSLSWFGLFLSVSHGILPAGFSLSGIFRALPRLIR